MKYLLLFAALSAMQGGKTADRCREREFRCELRCNDDTPGGSLKRMRCYERCREDENYCRKYAEDGP